MSHSIGGPAPPQTLAPQRRGTMSHVGHDTVAMAMVHACTNCTMAIVHACAMLNLVLAVRHSYENERLVKFNPGGQEIELDRTQIFFACARASWPGRKIQKESWPGRLRSQSNRQLSGRPTDKSFKLRISLTDRERFD